MKKKLLEVMFFCCQIIGKYNAIATLLGTLILKMVTNQQHLTYTYTRNDTVVRYFSPADIAHLKVRTTFKW